MTYFVDIFSIETFEKFSRSEKTVAGFHPSRRAWLGKIKPGDKIVCYLKGLSCWIGLLEVTGPLIEVAGGDEVITEYTLQFPVIPVVWLAKGSLIPIRRADVWAALSFTKNVVPGAGGWNAILRSSGVRLRDDDGALLEGLLIVQAKKPQPDNIAEQDWKKKSGFKISGSGGAKVTVVIPEPSEPDDGLGGNGHRSNAAVYLPARTSHKMQAMLAEIGIAMGFQVWIPKADKDSVAKEMGVPNLLSQLPFTQLSEPAIKTVEQIDVLWLQKKSIVRAFEVEHTTAVYSGILRMADLLALQPNFHTRLHIVAPEERRKKVFQELLRPAFAVFHQGPLSKLCSYLPYERIQKLAEDPNLEYLKEAVLDKFEEFADEDE